MYMRTLIFAYCMAISSLVSAHDGPDPAASWVLQKKRIAASGLLEAVTGPNLKVHGGPESEVIGDSSVLRFNGRSDYLQAEDPWPQVQAKLPKQSLTVAAWVSIDKTLTNGGIVSAFQDNGDEEYGWVLGFNESVFCFGLSTEGANDGNGVMTYLAGKTAIVPGKWCFVVGVYDGSTMQLWLDGALEAESKLQSGPILYPSDAKLSIASYCDLDECFNLLGRIASVEIYDVAAKKQWVKTEFSRKENLARLPPSPDPSLDFKFLVKPYLQYCTGSSIRVLCELTKAGEVSVEFGETIAFGSARQAVTEDGFLHSTLLDGLIPETGYYYQVVVKESDSQRKFRSEILSFQTATKAENPYSFAVIADTQGNPKVNGQLAAHAWALRPNFLVLPGDLVDDGTKKHQWVHEFFESMNPLISRVPLFPVLGNHEKNASHYYRYMDLPAPEYFYSFQYGNCMFYVLDSNKKVDAFSEQYSWLESQLESLRQKELKGESEVLWKFVTFHHPVYSSDENDYGDLWKGKSTWGDLRLRDLVALFDEYHVDIVWSGHIHSYERTWPLKDGKNTSQRNGTTYMITGGGGGGLEQAGPIRPWFQNNVKRGHHFVFVSINGNELELKSYDLEGHLFDTTTIHK